MDRIYNPGILLNKYFNITKESKLANLTTIVRLNIKGLNPQYRGTLNVRE